VSADPAPGLIGDTIGSPRDMTFHDGRLHVTAGNIALIDGGAWSYEPGAAGDLSLPTSVILTGLAPADRFLRARTVAVNASGVGFGAYTGSTPTLVHVGSVGSGDTDAFTIGGAPATLGPRFDFAPSFDPFSVEFVEALGQFAVIENSQPSPAVSTLSIRTHDAASGLGAASTSFSVTAGTKGVTDISAGFASLLLGQPVAQAALLTYGRNDFGLADPAFLEVYAFDGTRLGATDVVLPEDGLPPGSAAPRFDGWGVAVDEASGLLFIGERSGRIYTLTIPAPGSAALVLVLGSFTSRRRR
ncbi:MAG: hypothetical protein AAFX05_10505, partial [Planctomycetota bacterium]